MPRKSTAKAASRSARRRERMREALEYRKQGYNYREIAAAMKISVSTAHEYVHDALKEVTREPAQEVLAIHLERYDQMLTVAYEQALDGDLFAMDRVVNILGRIERLNGVEAPKEADQAAENHAMLNQLLASSLARIGGPPKE